MIIPEMTQYDSFFFDLDGVVWEAESALPGAVNFINQLHSLGKKVYYITNNASRKRKDFINALSAIGIQAELDTILCAAYSCSLYLHENYPLNTKVFVIGREGLIDEIKEAGYQVIEGISYKDTIFSAHRDFLALEIDPDIKCVIAGFTFEFNYTMLSYGSKCIQNGAKLATGNYDHYDRFGKYNAPSCGCIVDALRCASGVNEFENLGKPNTYLLEMICRRDRLDIGKIIVFGDKMATDIKLAKNFNAASVLMMTGAETRESYKKYDFEPDYVYDSMEDLLI